MIFSTNLTNAIWEDVVQEKSNPFRTAVVILLIIAFFSLLVFGIISDNIDLSALRYSD